MRERRSREAQTSGDYGSWKPACQAVISNSRLKAKCNRFRTTKVVAAMMIEILNRIELRKRGRSGLGVGKCLEEIEQPDQLKRLHNKFGRIDQFQRPALLLGRS